MWAEIAKRSFACLSWVNAGGAARAPGIVYAVAGGKIYSAAGNDSRTAKHIGEASAAAFRTASCRTEPATSSSWEISREPWTSAGGR